MFQQLIINSLIAGSIYALVALGFGIIYATTRFFHFAHGAVYTVGAYLTYLLVTSVGFPLFVSIFLSVVITSLIGISIEIGVYRPLRKREATSLVLLIASLGIFIVMQNIISLVFGDDTKSLRAGVVKEGIEILGARITPIQVAIIIVSLGLFIATSIILTRTKAGRTIRAVANDPELAIIHGIDTNRVIAYTFGMGSGLAAIAAILISFDVDMVPSMGFFALMMGVVAVIIGGVGSVPGAAFGGLLLGFAQNLGVWRIHSKWQDAIAFGVLLLFLLFRPYGFFGRKAKKVQI